MRLDILFVHILCYKIARCGVGCKNQDVGFNLEIDDAVKTDDEIHSLEGGGEFVWNTCPESVTQKRWTLFEEWRPLDEWECENCTAIDGRDVKVDISYSKSKLLAKTRLFRCGEEGVYLSTTVAYPGCKLAPQPRITGVLAYNLLPQMGFARIAKGGLDNDHVVLQLRSEKSHGFSYQIEIYGEL